MSQSNNNDAWLGEWFKLIGFALWLTVVGAWYLSMVLTRLLFEYVVNPLLDGALDKHNGDGLVIILSTGLWAGIALLLFGGLILPELGGASPAEFRQALLTLAGVGLVWGISIGFWLVVSRWSTEEMLEPVYEPERELGQGLKIVSAPSANGYATLPLRQTLEQELADIYREVDLVQFESVP